MYAVGDSVGGQRGEKGGEGHTGSIGKVECLWQQRRRAVGTSRIIIDSGLESDVARICIYRAYINIPLIDYT